MSDPSALSRTADWSGVRAVVLGFGPAGSAATDNLLHLGADVLAVDPDPGGSERRERAELLEVLGARVRLGASAAEVDRLPADVDVVVLSPGWRDDAGLLAEARRRALPVLGELDLAWRLRDPAQRAPWLCVTGATGAAETADLLHHVLRAAGLRSARVGLGGLPLVEAVMDPEPHDVLAVALSAEQLRHAGDVAAESAAVLDVGEQDPLALGRVFAGVRLACVYAVADPATMSLVEDAEVVEGARAIGITLGMPAISNLGVVEDLLVDRAFVAERASTAAELGSLADLGSHDPATIRNALAAAALARAHGVSQHAVRDGLRAAAGR